ncbi:MAG: response regulator [Cyclobacteriaceae bacterium]
MKPKILLVDDREDNLLSIEAILAQDGYKFTTAFSGNEALKILNREADFAMILMDVKMPILSGFETATLIYEREKLKHIPIIFITANYYGEENLFKGYKSGGIDYIFKPINPEVLRAKVSIFIDLYRKNRLLIEQDEKLLEINKNLAHEITHLRGAEERLTLINRNLRKKIADLEAIMAVSDIPMQQSEFVTSDLNALLEGLLNDMGEEAKTATISVGKLPSLCISPRLMRPLFQNLISNALLYRQKNIKPAIRIHSEMYETENGETAKDRADKYCRIFVEDNCNGFHQDLSGEIYGEFCDTDLGLAFYQKIMDHHKGFISAENKLNEGLTYILSLPVNNAQTGY